MNLVQRVGTGVALSVALLAGGAGAARAASMVYIANGNVFLAGQDGSRPYQVTLDGSTADPDRTAYRSPSEADDGTIVAAKGGELVHLAQNGAVLAHFIPATHAYPLAAAVSPDGRHIAYDYSQITQCTIYLYTCGYYPQPGAAIANVDGSGADSLLNGSEQDAQWIDNATLVLQTASSYVDSAVLGQGAQHWFAPRDAFNPFGDDFPYPEQPVASRAGGYLAVVLRPSASGGHPSAADVLEIWKRNGAPPAQPTPLCGFVAMNAGGFQDPQFTPDGGVIAWTDAAGIETTDIDAACQGGQGFTLSGPPAVAGASQASFSPAAANPGPRAGAPVPAPPAPSPAGAPRATPAPAAAAATAAVRAPGSVTRTALSAKGLRVTVTCSAPCTYTVAVTAGRAAARTLGLKAKGTLTLARRSATTKQATTQVTLKLSAAVRHALARLRHGHTLTLSVVSRTQVGAGAALTRRTRLTVKA